MPDGELTKITVCCDSGEDLYVHPYSVDGNWLSPKHRVRWIWLCEFNPCKNWQQDFMWDTQGVGGGSAFLHRLRRWFWMRPARWAVGVWTEFGYNMGWRWNWKRPRQWFRWLASFQLRYPILCLEAYPETLGLVGQLSVEDPEGLAETYYLVPSNKYVNQRLKQNYANWLERLGRGNLLKWEESDLEDLDKFLEWKERQEKLGREVHYLVSLNT